MLERSWVGRRVTLRRVLDRSVDGRPQFGDVVGDLAELSVDTARIRTRTALVEVRLALVVAAKLALPSTADVLALESITSQGWRPELTGQVGGWVLRAARGFTGRANSVLPLRVPGMPLEDAVAAARAWYTERGLPLRIQVPIEARWLLDGGLAELGWPADPDVHVLAARLDALLRASTAADPGVGPGAGIGVGPGASPRVDAEVEIVAAPGPEWFAAYRGGAGAAAPARALLTRHDRVGFASITRGGRPVAIARGAIDEGWLGISAVEVVPELRRQGLASVLMRALWCWASAAGAERSYVQVSSENAAAEALYQSLGYWHHHSYRYRHDPQG